MVLRSHYRWIILTTGIFLGVFIANCCLNYNRAILKSSGKQIPFYETWFRLQGYIRKAVLWDYLRYSIHDNHITESQLLFTKIKIMCIVLVRNEKNLNAASATWATSCNDLKTIELDQRNTLVKKRLREKSSWVLLCTTLKNITNEYDWYLVVHDSTFVILENLRYYVLPFNSSDKWYLGHALKFWNTKYNSGEAGYVLSRGTLQDFKNFNAHACLTDAYWNREDFYLGKYLARMNITPIDTKDRKGLSIFHPYNWYHVFFPGESHYKMSLFPAKCCSKFSITFQAIEGDKMYTYYYLLYRLQIFTYGHLGNRISSQASDSQVWRKFLKERNLPSDNISSEQYYKIWENLIDDPTSFAAHMKKESYVDEV